MMLVNDRQFRHFDFGLFFCVLLLIVLGLTALFSATFVSESQGGAMKFNKQLFWALLGIAALAITTFTPIRFFSKYAYTIYFVTVLMLVLVLFAGSGAGTKRWLNLGSFWIQPSEFAKIGVILALSKFLSSDSRNLNKPKDLIVAFVIVFVPLVLVMQQPDLGSSLVFLAVILPILHWSGLSPVILFVLVAPAISLISAFNYYSFLIAMLIICLILLASQRGLTFFLINFIINIGVGIITPILWNFLKDYQKNRILTFLGLIADPHGLGYQVIQSKVAIGSGGFWGKGFLEGTQTHLRFLPEQHTDFIFCVIAEEFGFFGSLITLSLFVYLIFKGINIACFVKSKFLSTLVFGGTVIFLFQIFVNIGMTAGIMPVTGLPLPFLSYGGSSLLSNMILIGLFLNASRKRFEYI